jgi:NitT/TauT family transport system substrate-binding protein
VRQAYKDLGLDYDKQLASMTGDEVTGEDPVCNAPVNDPKQAGQIWIEGGDIVPFSSPVCTLLGVKKFTGQGRKLNAVYLVDHTLGIKLFADAAFYAIGQDQKKPDVVPFMLKKDAEAYAAKIDGKLGTYADALAAINVGQ